MYKHEKSKSALGTFHFDKQPENLCTTTSKLLQNVWQGLERLGVQSGNNGGSGLREPAVKVDTIREQKLKRTHRGVELRVRQSSEQGY